MKTLDEIYIDFERSKKKASEIDEIAAEMERIANGELSESMRQLSNAWKGEASEAYQQKLCLMQEQIWRNAKEMKTTAESIRSIAKRTYNAEKRAYQLAIERFYEQ